MKINILTIFPEMFTGWMETGMIKQALDKQKIEIKIIYFREYSKNKHNKVDDYPFGGGEGMLLMIQPLHDALIKNDLIDTHVIYPSPCGVVLNQLKLQNLAKYDEITLVAGRYEGIDQRFVDNYVNEEISIGDYIITGGELSIQIILDGIIRLLDGVLNNADSAIKESFSDNLLEYPQYTRPAEFMGLKVPEVLISGHHQKILKWQQEQQIQITLQKRPDLLKKQRLEEQDE